jgi:nucleotide-binding universal stress UspA family protein
MLHATDFSPASRPAFVHALRIARASGAELVLVNVTAPPSPVLEDSYFSARSYQRMLAARRGEAERKLTALRGRAGRAGVRASVVVRDGTSFEEIVAAARQQRADLIVIGTHGRSGLGRLVLGSVAERVIGLASCPVLTVRSG